jgi:sulfide:quinone oxidoreductase
MAGGGSALTVDRMTQNPQHQVVVAGGGIAALEFVLALRDLAGDRVDLTLVAPDRELLLRPTLVGEPLGGMAGTRRSLSTIAKDLDTRLVPASVKAVDPERGRIVLRAGGAVDYDTLVLAPGARRLPAFDDAIHIGDEAGTRALATLRDEIVRGDVRSVAFVAPTLTGWLLPLYEAALLTARLGADVSLITAEERPLALFGAAASEAVENELTEAGVSFLGGRRAIPEWISPDRVVSLPLIRGPRIDGVPTAGMYGLIPVDDYGRVHGLPGAYAIGDATDFPIKQGGLACQQAGAAALHVAARHGAPVRPEPFRPQLRATLLTGGAEPLELGEGPGTGKVPGHYLGPYLAGALV